MNLSVKFLLHIYTVSIVRNLKGREKKEDKHYAEKTMKTIEEGKNIVSRNVKPDDYYILKNTKVPAVLVEIG